MDIRPTNDNVYTACLINKKMIERIENVSQDLADAEEFVSDVVSGIHRNAIVYGPPGLGKTHIVEAALKNADYKIGEDYLIARSHTTPRQLYAMLYCMRKAGQFVVIDDCDAVLTSEDGLNVLKAATDPTFRTVGWTTSKSGVRLPNGEEVPDQYEFNGSVIIATNVRQSIKGKSAQHFAALRSRCPGWALTFNSREEQFAYIVHLIVNKNYLDRSPETQLTWAQKIELIKFIMSNLSQVETLDLRKPQHIAKVMRHKANWQNHALKFLKDVV
jgi:Cdc6-like AAA superfamily ATPase